MKHQVSAIIVGEERWSMQITVNKWEKKNKRIRNEEI